MYMQEPLESLITPAGFAPATYPPSVQPSPTPSTSQSVSVLPSSQIQPQVSSYSQFSAQPVIAEGCKIVPHTTKVEESSSDHNSAASVLPSDGVPSHPDLIDPGPHFTNTGTYIVYIHVHLFTHVDTCMLNI